MRRRSLTVVPCVSLLILAIACGDDSPSPTTPTTTTPTSTTSWSLSGIVRASAPTSTPLAGATLRVIDGPDEGKTATTDNVGVYEFTGLEQAGFRVSASADGYSTVTESVTLTSNVTLDFELQPILTVLTFISAETQRPVAGARVTAAGESYTTDAAGKVFVQNPSANIPLVVSAPSFLERRTVLRSLSETTFSLWPKTSPTGLNEHFTLEIIYTAAVEGPLGSKRLTKVRGNRVSIVLEPALRSDSRVRDAVRGAVDRITAATDRAVVYELVDTCPAGNACFTVVATPDRCGVDANRDGYYLTGGAIRCEMRLLRHPGVMLHEMGHTLGLQHASSNAVMNGPVGGRGEGFNNELNDYTPKEKLVMRLMLQRPPGNAWPDNDQGVSLP